MELYRIVVALLYKDVAPHRAGICCGIVLQRCRPSRGWRPLPQKRRRRGISVETTAIGIFSPVGRHRPMMPLRWSFTGLLWHCSTKMSPLTGLGFVTALFYKDAAPHGAGDLCRRSAVGAASL